MAALLHGPLVLFIAQALLIVGVSRLVGLLAKRLRQPMVIAEITAGIALGPSLLGWLFPEFSAAVFPKSSLSTLSLMSQVGLLLFMFLVGLEFDPKLLRGRGHTSIAISHTSIVVPFGLGSLLALYLYPRVSDGTIPFSSFALFMGVAMSITAFPVLARILVERRLLRTKVGAITITCAAVDDVTAWCILAFVVSIVRFTGVADAIRTSLLAIGYIVAMLLLIRPLLARLADRARNREGLSQNLVAVTLMLVLLSSWATEIIGIHALFGAFILGAVIPKEQGFAGELAGKLEDVVVVLLLPLFFAYSGLRTQIGLLDSPGAWGLCALIILVACTGKFGGSVIAARLTGMPWREASALGILMNTRGLMELIVLNIGLDLGVISPMLFTMMVLMALVTTFMTTPLLEWIYPTSELAKQLDQPGEVEALHSAPSPFTLVMCVAYDRTGPGMMSLAGALIGKKAAHRLYALRLVPPADRASFVMTEQLGKAQSTALAPLLERASELGIEVRPLSFVSGQPAVDICQVAAAKGANLVMLGWHKPLVGQAVLRGTVHDVMESAPADVAVLIDRGLTQVRRVLVPYLGGPHDTAALRLAHRLATESGAEVTILHVVTADRRGKLGVARQIEELTEQGPDGRVLVRLEVVEHDEPARAALEHSAHGYDLVLVGIGSEWGLEHRLFGLQAERLISECPTSLLVVRDGTALTAEERQRQRARPDETGAWSPSS
ncbi:MAG TPA: cation:proton antiporter [Polyangiaceae bacterium]|nr:cation:proton antiporter [Polyangiaceae bacterium]